MAFKSTDSGTGGSEEEDTTNTSTSSSTSTSTSTSTSQPLDDLQSEIDENERKAQETTDPSNETDYATTPAPDTSTPTGGTPDEGGAAPAPTSDSSSSDTGSDGTETSTPTGGSPDEGGIAGPVGSGETREPESRSPSAKERARRDDAVGAGGGAGGGGAGGGFGQGVETGSGRVAQQARELEREVLAQYGALSASDVAVRERGDRLVATVSDAGRRRVVSEALSSPGAGNKGAAVNRARSRTRENAFGDLPEGFVTGKREAVREQQDREDARAFSAAVGDVQVTSDAGGAGEAVRGVRGREARNAFSRASSPREMRVATAMAYDEAVAKANQEYKERKTEAYVSPREAERAEIIDYDWSFGAGDPDKDEVEQFFRNAQRKWETESIGVFDYRTDTSVRDIREGFGRELTDSQQASEAYAESQGMTNAEYGMSQLMGAPVSGRGPTYVSRTGADTLGVLPSTLPLNLPGAVQGGMELVEATTGSYVEREQAQDEALDAITSGEPGRITENPETYRNLAIQAATGLPTADTESAKTLREGGRYTVDVGREAAAYAAENPNKAVTGGALIAGQSLVGGAALARVPGAARKAASLAPDGSSARRFLSEERAMAKLTGRSKSKNTGGSGQSVSSRVAARIKNPSLRDVDPRKNDGDSIDGGGNPEGRGLNEQGAFEGSYTHQQDPAFGGTGKPGSEPDFTGVRERLAEGSYKITGRKPVSAQEAATMSYDEFAAANRATGRSLGAASGITGGALGRVQDAQQPQAVLDDPVTGQQEDLTYATGLYGGTVAGQTQQYRTTQPSIADTTQLWSDQPTRDATDTGQEPGLTGAQASIGDTRTGTGSEEDTDAATRTGAGTDAGVTPDVDVGQPGGQTPGQMEPVMDTPIVEVPQKPTPQQVIPGPNPFRFPWTPRRTPDPDVGDESPDARPRPEPDSRRPSIEFESPGRATNPINELAVAMAFGLSAGPRRLPERSAAGAEYDDQFGTPTAVEVSGSESEQEAIEAAKARLSGLQLDPAAFFGDGASGDSGASDGGGFDWF